MTNSSMDTTGWDNVQTTFNCYEVQRTICAHLSLKDIKSLRLVNTEWRHAGVHALKEKSLVTLNSPLYFQNYMRFLDEQEEKENGQILCFSNYRIILKPDKFESMQQANLLFSQFWNKCGGGAGGGYGCVKELSLQFPWILSNPVLNHIYSCSSGDETNDDVGIERLALTVEDYNVVREESDEEGDQGKWSATGSAEENECSQDKFVINRNIVLSSLHLNVSIVLSSEKKVFPFSWVQFLSSCPNICHLSIQSDYASGQFYRLINALVDRGVRLKTLKIGMRNQSLFSDDFLKKLVLLTGDETETVSLGFLPSVKHNTPLDLILRQASSSLKQLTFLQCRTANQGTISSFTASDLTFCSCFPRLTSMRITKDLVPNLSFLVKMPKLRRLEIYRDSTVGQHDALSNPVIRTASLSVVMENLQSLVLEPFVPVEHVWKMTNWFPNVRRLQMRVNDVIVRTIFTKWTQLRELFLIGEVSRDSNDIVRSALTDEGITGLSKEDLQQSGENQQDGGTVNNAISITGRRTMAYIGNLKQLETCKLQVVPDYQTGLTDYSIYYGLADVTTLQSVSFVKTLVTPSGADKLRKNGVHVIISRV